LRGLKENVIIGRLIPAGTGMEMRRRRAEERARLARLALEEEEAREQERARRFLLGEEETPPEGLLEGFFPGESMPPA